MQMNIWINWLFKIVNLSVSKLSFKTETIECHVELKYVRYKAAS